MQPKTALRIALALERIADRLELLTVDTTPETPQPEIQGCLHPFEDRLVLGMTDGWVCGLCLFTQPPSDLHSGQETTTDTHRPEGSPWR